MKGRENKVADRLSRLFPIQQNDLSHQAVDSAGIEPKQLKKELSDIETFDTSVNKFIIIQNKLLEGNQRIEMPERRMCKLCQLETHTKM